MGPDPKKAAAELLGPCGRMISSSKTLYRRAHPEAAVIFNANVCTGDEGKVWYGDLDLTVDEPLLLDLADRLGSLVYVLWEYDGRFDNEAEPLLKNAAYRAIPGRQCSFDEGCFGRGVDGRLRRLPPEAQQPPHTVIPFDWDGRRRPRLLAFWRLQFVSRETGCAWLINWLLYVGKRGSGGPLLVLGLHRLRPWSNPPLVAELSWYPSRGPHRSRAFPAIKRELQVGPISLGATVFCWPGFMHEIRVSAGRRRVER